MPDIIASIINHYKTKASTTLFMVYFSFWAIFHSEGIICLFFTNQDLILEKFGMLKNEYLYTYFFGFHFDDLQWWIRFITPFALATLYILFFSKIILNPAYKYDLKFKTDRKITKAREENRFQEEKLKLDKTLAEREENKAKIEEAQKRQTEANPEVQWERDYLEMARRYDLNEVIRDLKKLIYDYNYRISDSYAGMHVKKESLIACEVYGLVVRNDANWNLIKVTEKGWYFIRKHG